MKPENRRKRYFANKLHKEIFLFLAFASVVPALLVTLCLYYLIFNIVSQEVGIPEGMAYYVIPAAKRVSFILLVAAPVTIAAILFAAYQITHRMLGLYDRVVRELDAVIHGTKNDHIRVRNKDKLWPLVERINKLIDKVRK